MTALNTCAQGSARARRAENGVTEGPQKLPRPSHPMISEVVVRASLALPVHANHPPVDLVVMHHVARVTSEVLKEIACAWGAGVPRELSLIHI